MYDSIEKMIVRFKDIVFVKGQTIDDIDKAIEITSQGKGRAVDVDLV